MRGYEIPDDMQFLAEGHAVSSEACCTSTWARIGAVVHPWLCTRVDGHAGKHEAGYGNGWPVRAVWDDEDES